MIVKLHTACSSCNGIIIKVALEAFKLSIKKISELYKPLLSFTISQHHGACYEILGATDALSASNLQRKFSIKVSMVTKRRGHTASHRWILGCLALTLTLSQNEVNF